MAPSRSAIRVGIAGWAIPATHRTLLPMQGTHLARYAQLFSLVEINSSFYRPHRRATYEKWADTVPAAFRFTVKVPKAITHIQRLSDCEAELDDFLSAASGLGNRLGAFLVQLPPSLEFEERSAQRFFTHLRASTTAFVSCEPRHASWSAADAMACLDRLGVGRVMADPPAAVTSAPLALEADDDLPARSNDSRLIYIRLHGSPRTYYSSYPDGFLRKVCTRARAHSVRGSYVWCIFDNTAERAAWSNALTMKQFLEASA